jgi:hypothetical protein
MSPKDCGEYRQAAGAGAEALRVARWHADPMAIKRMSIVDSVKALARPIVARALTLLSPNQRFSLAIRLLDRLPPKASQTMFLTAAAAPRKQLYDELKHATGRKIQDGPFKGMRLPDIDAFGWDRDHVPKLLGFYEAELHTAIYHTLAQNHDCVVNVGCGDGYYAVGYALSLATAKIFAFDTDPGAQKLCRACAEENGVLDRVQVGGSIDAFMLQNLLVKWKKPLLLVDCEGCEFYLMRPDSVPQLRYASFIVECHNFAQPKIVSTLVERFRETHKITLISEGPRNPNCSKFLRNRHSLLRWLAVLESRSEAMEWLWGTPLSESVSSDSGTQP